MTGRLAGILLIPCFVLAAAFGSMILAGKTIAPVELYWATPGNYRMGDYLRVPNHYQVDITNALIPWKYYLTQFHPDGCQADVGTPSLSHAVSGVMLPQGICYPLGAVRPYLRLDSVLVLARVFPFLVSYDLSYLGLLLLIYGATLFLIHELLVANGVGELPRERLLLSALSGSVFATGFSMSRDLQWDSLSQSYPFTALALAFALRGLSGRGRRWTGFVGSVLFGALMIMKSTLQGVAINIALIALILAVLCPRHLVGALRSRWSFSAGVALVLSGFVVIWHLPGALVFLSNPRSFVPNVPLSAGTALIHRACAYLFSVGHFFLGEILASFQTIDFSKGIGPLGAREYSSYDGDSFFLSPVVSFFFIALAASFWSFCGSSAGRKALTALALGLGTDLLLSVLPTYRLVYLRLHAVWASFLLAYVFVVLMSEGARAVWNRRTFALLAGLAGGLAFSGLAVGHAREVFLARFQGHGTFGFDPGFWPEHLDRFIRRLEFRDLYSVAFFAVGVLGLLLVQRRAWVGLLLLLSVTGPAINLFHYNSPQPRERFDAFLVKMAGDPGAVSKPPEGPGLEITQNVNLLVNRPAWRIYESLRVDPKPESQVPSSPPQ